MWSGTFPWPGTWRTIGRVGIGSAAAGLRQPGQPRDYCQASAVQVRNGLFMTSTSAPNAEVAVEQAHGDDRVRLFDLAPGAYSWPRPQRFEWKCRVFASRGRDASCSLAWSAGDRDALEDLLPLVVVTN